MPDIDFSLSDGETDWSDPGEQLTDDEVAKLLAERLGFGSKYAAGMRGGNPMANEIGRRMQPQIQLVNQLVQMLPPELRTRGVIERMDLRPLLQPVMSTEYRAQQRGDITVNGQVFTPEMQAAAGALFVDFQSKVRREVEQNLLDSMTPAEEIPGIMRDRLEAWRDAPGTITPVPTFSGTLVLDAAGSVASIGANADLQSLQEMLNEVRNGASAAAAQAPAFLTAEDVRLLFRDESPNTAIGMYMNDLGQRSAYAQEAGVPTPPDALSVEMTAPTGSYGPYMRPGASPQARNQAATGAQSYTLTQALSLPDTMTREEVASLTRKMQQAGLFAQVGGSPLVNGDPTDPRFKEAYRLLLSKSIQRNRPVSTVLDEDRLAYTEALEENVRAQLTDPARLRISADVLGRELLGRKLTSQEHAKLVQQIHGFQRQQAVAEMDGSGSVEDVDWEARMQEAIVGANPGEAGAVDQAAQYDTFRALLSGPGGQR